MAIGDKFKRKASKSNRIPMPRRKAVDKSVDEE